MLRLEPVGPCITFVEEKDMGSLDRGVEFDISFKGMTTSLLEDN